MAKIKLGIMFGGKSAEHEVSIVSAQSVIDNLNKEKYDIIPIQVDKDGNFDITLLADVNIVFPVMHGTYGEDGSVQGMLKFFNIPFVGPDITGSAVGMDKDICKKVLISSNIPCAKGITLYKHENIQPSYEEVANKLGNIVFVKPANLGSSVGISKVTNKEEYNKALEKAFLYDKKIIIEEFIKGREIECAVLGNENPKASMLGEIIPTKDFYSYEAKYIDSDGAILEMPAKIPEEISNKIREVAVKTFKALNCEGLSRVDFFLKENGEFIVNEINTIPGFTSISMYPKLWKITGMPYSELLDKLIDLAIARHERDSKLKVSFKD